MVIERPLKTILDRDVSLGHINEHFIDQVHLLRELVNYGTNLIVRCFISSDRQLTDMIVLGNLLKQVVAMLDAVEILITNGAVHAAYLPARTLWEATLYMEWILKEDSDFRSKIYYVSNIRRHKQWQMRGIKGSDEYNSFYKKMGDIGATVEEIPPDVEKQLRRELKDIDRLLDGDEYKKINDRFNELKRGKRDAKWYKQSGVNNIWELASKLGREPEYEIFYRYGSEISHSSSYKKHMKISKSGDKQEISFIPIRHLEDVDQVLTFVISFTLVSYRKTLEFYRSGEVASFNRKYKSEWRDAFLNIKKVHYSPEKIQLP